MKVLMFKRLCFGALLSLSTLAAAEPLKGLDLIGLKGFSQPTVKNIIETIPPRTVIGALLDDTFGTSDAPVVSLCQSGKVSDMAVDLLNTTAVRNGKLHKAEALYGYNVKSLNRAACAKDPKFLSIIDSRLKRLEGLQYACPATVFHVSLFLEHDLERMCAETILLYAKSRLQLKPWGQWIDNPVTPKANSYPYAPLSGTFTEAHGNEPKLSNVISNDGASAWDANYFGDGSYIKRSPNIVLIWIHEFNKNKTGIKVFVDPLKRPHSNEPTADQIRHALYLLNHPSAPPVGKPNQCKTVRPLKKPELWKVSAEDYGTPGDRRASRPLLIVKSKRERTPILSVSGKEVGYLRYYGSYSGTPGFHRHYLGSGSGDSSMTLIQKAGGEWVFINDGGNCLLVNAPRRAGYFR